MTTPDTADFAFPSDGFSEKPTPCRAEILARGRAALKRRIRADKASWPDWQDISRMLFLGHREVLAKLGLSSNREVDLQSLGRTYTGPFNQWLLDRGMPKVEATSRAAAIRCAPILDQINEWRATLKPGRLARLLGPQGNLKGYMRSIAPPDPPPPPPPVKLFPDDLTIAEIAAMITKGVGDGDRVREIADLLVAQGGGWDHMVSLVVGSPLEVIRELLIYDMGLSYADLQVLANPDLREDPEPPNPRSVLFSSNSVEHPTPDWLFDRVHKILRFTRDLAASPETAKLERFYTIEDDALKQDWSGERGFLNPPFGRNLGQWLKKAYESSKQGATILCLLPASTDTPWYHDWCSKADKIVFIRGRLRFGAATNSAPKGTMLVLFTPNGQRDGKPEIFFDLEDFLRACDPAPTTSDAERDADKDKHRDDLPREVETATED